MGNYNGNCTCEKHNCKDIGKHPLTDNGCLGATIDPDKIEEYFGGDYDKANIGIATGKMSAVWVVDADDPAQLQLLTEQHGPLPMTPSVKTSRGMHYYFRYPSDRTIRNSQSKMGQLANSWVRQ